MKNLNIKPGTLNMSKDRYESFKHDYNQLIKWISGELFTNINTNDFPIQNVEELKEENGIIVTLLIKEDITINLFITLY